QMGIRDSPSAAPPAEPPRLQAGPPPGPGYLIQLGVFLDTANAESMRRELERKGYPAHLQARVVLGPYPDRESAIAAQEKVRRERKLDGMILGPRK
uniref:SPOR domain-containing protein n=1 Tax=Aromatoleum evansii TaxID=59406 RepID=UPI001B7CEC24